MEKLKTATTQAATIAAILGLQAGHGYITAGHGLHPMAAGAIAAVLILGPYFVPERQENRRRSRRAR
jgi:hypothetical protein